MFCDISSGIMIPYYTDSIVVTYINMSVIGPWTKMLAMKDKLVFLFSPVLPYFYGQRFGFDQLS